MSLQKGRDLLLKIADNQTEPAFVTVAGLRARSISFNAKSVDVTDSESAGWRELMGQTGLRSMAVTGQGIFRDAASDALLREAFFTQELKNWQIVIPDFGIFSGPFLISSLDFSGNHDAEAQFGLSISSAGVIDFAAL